eukprot:6719797-Prymnesium_polylepis.1
MRPEEQLSRAATGAPSAARQRCSKRKVQRRGVGAHGGLRIAGELGGVHRRCERLVPNCRTRTAAGCSRLLQSAAAAAAAAA